MLFLQYVKWIVLTSMVYLYNSLHVKCVCSCPSDDSEVEWRVMIFIRNIFSDNSILFNMSELKSYAYQFQS